MRIEFQNSTSFPDEVTNTLVVPFLEDELWTDFTKSLDARTGGALSKAVNSALFLGKRDQLLDIFAPSGLQISRLIVVGLGLRSKLTSNVLERAAARAFSVALPSATKLLVYWLRDLPPHLAAHVPFGSRLASYRFERYTSVPKSKNAPAIEGVLSLVIDEKAARAAFKRLDAIAEGIFLARDLVNEPANVLTPTEFARRAQDLTRYGMKVEVFDEKDMRELGMTAALAVGQGSEQKTHLAILKWEGAADPNSRPVGIVGKGVCFDAGGISLKKPEGMEDMKDDMAGAAAVTGLMLTLALQSLPVNVVGILGLVENMPDGGAIRPGDVLTSMSGKTIEVIDTDAEGRLVLADALTYCQKQFSPSVLLDVATLTSASIVALGQDYGAFFTSDEMLSSQLTSAADSSGERLWRLPLYDGYARLLHSDCADMKNSGGAIAGAITAALFLRNFIEDVSWAHLDIAGVVFRRTSDPLCAAGATGYGVRLLEEWVRQSHGL